MEQFVARDRAPARAEADAIGDASRGGEATPADDAREHERGGVAVRARGGERSEGVDAERPIKQAAERQDERWTTEGRGDNCAGDASKHKPTGQQQAVAHGGLDAARHGYAKWRALFGRRGRRQGFGCAAGGEAAAMERGVEGDAR